MDDKTRMANTLELVGGELCLDFANTVSSRTGMPRREYLTTYDELIAWSEHARILTGDEVSALLHRATRHPDLAADVLDRAIALREAVYRVFSAIVDHRATEQADLAVLNNALHQALARLEVRASTDGFKWAWTLGEDDLDRMLWPVAQSAARLLISGDLTRVRQCAREGCDWLFVDLSKNRSRRWCMMGVCGSRVKARRYYRRRKKASQ